MPQVLHENGFDYRISIPDKFLPFRLADCTEYKRISGRGFKEVEAGWLDNSSSNPKVVLMELKVWYDDSNPDYKEVKLAANQYDIQTTEYVRDNLAKKVIDVLYLLTQSRSIIDIKPCVNDQIIYHLNQGKAVVLIFVIKARPNYNLTPVKTAFC